jgi:hypothetical protein
MITRRATREARSACPLPDRLELGRSSIFPKSRRLAAE